MAVAVGSGFGSKPRPAVSVQADLFAGSTTCIVLMFTTERRDERSFRPIFQPSESNGLRSPSSLMVDIPITVPIDRIGSLIGRLSPDDMADVDRLLMLVFDLGPQ